MFNKAIIGCSHPAKALVICLSAALFMLPVTLQAVAENGTAAISVPMSAMPNLAAGQRATQLPDGNWLITGGEGSRSIQLYNRKTQQTHTLSATLQHPRSQHSATLLPDGSVLILGGIDAQGNLVEQTERYDPASQQITPLTNIGLGARSGHSVTVLSDGKLLIAGGVNARGKAIVEVELYDPQTQQTERINANLDTPRSQHQATLLANGNVQIQGGASLGADNIEQYDSRIQRIQRPSAAETVVSNPVQPAISASQPEANGNNAAVNQPISLRFNQRMDITSLNRDTVTLMGPHGKVAIKVTPVEQGQLLFVSPEQELLPASRYTLFIKGAQSQTGQPLEFTALGFDTEQLDGPRNNLSSNRASLSSDKAGNNPAGTASNKNQNQAHNSREVQYWTQTEQLLQQKTKEHSATLPEHWIPEQKHQHGDWRAGHGHSPLQELPPLQAAPGVTALAGQALSLNGMPLVNATLSITGPGIPANANVNVRTDQTGRFLITGLNVGPHILTLDGSTATTRPGVEHGTYQVRVEIEAGKTNALDYTMWSTPLDHAGDIRISSPTQKDIVLTSPRIPGLELHVPAGTIIRDRNGKIVTELNMTAIPTDHPPFPIPSVGVPVYFTIQPGGATLTSTNGKALQGARLIYPNFAHANPGTRIDFWNYDTESKGWYVYGQGTVSEDGKQVIPDAGVQIYEFTGAMISNPNNAPSNGPPPSCGTGNGAGGPGKGTGSGNPPLNNIVSGANKGGDPIDLYTGLFLHERSELYVDDIAPIEIRHTYRPQDSISRGFGVGTNLNYDIFLVGNTNPWSYQELILADGGRIRYNRTSSGTGYTDAIYGHNSTNTIYAGSTISYKGGNCFWELKLTDGSKMCFPEAMNSTNPRAGAVNAIIDRYGNTTTLSRDSANAYRLTRITSPSGRFIDLSYDVSHRITQATDNLGRKASYLYSAAGDLIQATDPANLSEYYTYDSNHNLLTVKDPRGNIMVSNVYDANNRVIKQTYADATTNTFAYTLDTAGKVIQTSVTNERGKVRKVDFNSSGNPIKVTDAAGLAEQRIITIERHATSNQILSVTDALGRKTSYTYDSKGNILTTTSMAGTTEAVTVTMTYTGDYNQLASYTDELGRKTILSYDMLGNLIQVQDANGNKTSLSYNSAGLPIKLTDALGKITSLGYDQNDLSQITDPLNRTSKRFTDAAGRTRSSTDPLGNRYGYEWDAIDRLIKVTDPLNQTIINGYDNNGNLTSVTDPKGNIHKFAYDTRDANSSETNPLNVAESYVYDTGHNLTKKTDRKGQITQYTYDNLDRLTKVTYHDASSVSYSYDKADRVTGIVDSANGTINFVYDNHDRITKVTTPKGSVNYSYYANGLRKTLDVANMPTLTYTYDAADRLTRIDQAAGAINNNVAQNVRFVYDTVNRVTQVIYTNGITRNHTYDAAGQLTAIVYKKADGVTVIGDLSYSYDANGRRTLIGGTLSNANQPAELTSSTVDAANRLTAANGQALTYDANGNLIADGTQTYVWNARNQLAQIKNSAGTVIASFTYDALGRRQTKTVNGVSSGFVYDGANIVQELSGADNSLATNIRSSYLSVGIDQMMVQFTGSGTTAQINTYLTDALGSTISLVNAAATPLVNYTYDPYGNTTASATVNNAFQYTGRENDGNGLYYYRARYYSPKLQRFISSDPIGLSGGINTFGYVGGNPVSFTDPSGTVVPAVAAAYGRCVLSCTLMGAATDAATGQCVDLGSTAGGCAVDCLNPLNYIGGGKSSALPKLPKGKGSVPPEQRDPKRVWTKSENENKLQQQGGNCAECGQPKTIDETRGHHANERHADGGLTDDANHAVVCVDCHKDLHR